MILFKIGVFDFNIASIFSFIAGILAGAILVCLIYVLVVLSSLKKNEYIINPSEGMDYDEVKILINEAIIEFNDKKLRKKNGKYKHALQISKDLAYAIAKSYFPKSRDPFLELSVDEAIKLIEYIDKKIDALFNNKIMKLIRNVKISTIYGMAKSTSKVVNSKALKNTSKVFNVIKKAWSVINPLTYIKRVPALISSAIINRIMQIIIGIVGEETYKIYSKKIFKPEDSIVEELTNDLTAEINNIILDEQPIEYKLMTVHYNINESKLDYESIYDNDMKLAEVKNEE